MLKCKHGCRFPDYETDQNTFHTKKEAVADELPPWYANDFGCTVDPH